ncbi:MAG: hypothetical protein HY736_25700 [Verrucomicrobia bacterium]|nr:hypothetical protein [Verrucomicrobiota bacterium]
MSSFRQIRYTRLALGVIGLAAGLHRLHAEDKAADPIIELPRFVVTETRELPRPEAWRYAQIPGFEILTNASNRTTQRLINDFELFKQALGVVWPAVDRMSVPVALILCAKGAKFDAFIPAGTGATPEMARASLFLKGRTQTAIIIDLQASELNILSTETDTVESGTDSGRISVDHNKQLYREYVHYLLSMSEPRLPAWFEEGMAQIIMAMRVDRKLIEFGRLEDPNTISAQAAMTAQLNAAIAADDPEGMMLAGAPAEDRDFNAALHRKALVSMEKFLAIKHDAPEALNPLGNNRWAKQAYAFVHMGLFGDNGRWQKPFAQFLARAAKEPVTEEIFKECFKMTYNAMLLQLRGYVEFTSYKSQEYRAKGEGLPRPPPLALRDATQAEVGRIKGEALLLAGRKDAARAELIAPYVRNERDPGLLAALGLYEHAAGQAERARKFLEAAVLAKVVRPDAYLELARYRYADALAQPAAAEGRFSPAQVAGIVGLLLTARTQPPPTPGVYELMADTWVRSASTPTREDLIALVDGVRRFPGRLKLAFQAAALCGNAGLAEAAHSLADHGIKVAPDAAAKARFEQLKQSLPPAPLAPAAPAASAAPAK